MQIEATGTEEILSSLARLTLLGKNPEQLLGEQVARPIYNVVTHAYESESDTQHKKRRLCNICYF